MLSLSGVSKEAPILGPDLDRIIVSTLGFLACLSFPAFLFAISCFRLCFLKGYVAGFLYFPHLPQVCCNQNWTSYHKKD